MTQAAEPELHEPDAAMVRRAVFASAIGNAVEWYDYGVFTAGAITGVVGTIFFPGDQGGTAVLKSLRWWPSVLSYDRSVALFGVR
ncbi:hypothetical protein [Fodinicola feengrottensis]|uniref:hypothetical protein n=1 Tax=Fodinicola feengrottensis TaxID=435914 RepID=UPI0024432A80|nr:hypothetical protein [Fodinicola feengrottensis]